MRMIFALFVLSLAGVAASFYLPDMEGLLLLAGPLAFAGLILLTQDLWSGGPSAPPRTHDRLPDSRSGKPVVIDGSNVMHWRDGTPDLTTVAEVIRTLQARGFAPGVMFDATVGHKIGSRYQDDAEIARRLGLPEANVLVVPKGTAADEYILKSARELGAPIVSNDRYRDWTEAHPEVTELGRVMRGGFRQGQLWLGEVS